MEPKQENPINQVKVIIGVPCSDTDAMRALTAQAIGGAIIGAGGLVTDMILRRSCDIASNRTWLVKQALEANATHLLFVDSDMLFPYEIIPKLLAHGKEIVGVEYKKREFPVKLVSEPMEERSDTELYRAKYVGTGLLLIDLSVFRNPKFGIAYDGKQTAWFNFGRDSEGNLVMGEDVWFCNLARDAGYDVWIDPTIKVGHIGEYIY